MSEFIFQNKKVYYEEHGSGEPLVVLNGIFMSCKSWEAFKPAFSERNRLILIDMLDQGLSEKMDKEYTQEIQVQLIVALIEHLGLSQINLMGISYGGEVAIKLATAYPSKVKKLVLSNTVAYTSKWLKDIGHSWEYAFKSYDGHQFFKTCIPIVYAPKFYEKNYEWASEREEMFVKYFTKEVYDSFGRLTRSSENHDERENLKNITAETMVISAELDFITPVYQQKEIAEGINNACHVIIPDAGHAVMYEKPTEFSSIVLGFINHQKIGNVL